MDNADCHYRYKWHAGPWGEAVKNYHASLRVLAGDLDETCLVQWASEFDYPTDAISQTTRKSQRAARGWRMVEITVLALQTVEAPPVQPGRLIVWSLEQRLEQSSVGVY